MATSRLLKISLPKKIDGANNVSRPMTMRVVMCLKKVGDTRPVAVKAAATASVLLEEKGLDLGFVFDHNWGNFITKPTPSKFNIQMFLEKAILDCRFFSLLAISGSLLGSVLCFVEGCFMVMVSYAQYLDPLSKMCAEGRVVMKLIEAIDMFLMGTAMLVFALSLYVTFVGQINPTPRNTNLKKLASSAMQAKSKMGHALIMILQIQVLDKSKSIAVSNGMDLAYFAATIFLSSASILLLSRTNFKR